MEGSVLHFLKAEWKMSDTGSAHWACSSILLFQKVTRPYILFLTYMQLPIIFVDIGGKFRLLNFVILE
jgi:hypothetical protein